MFETAYLDRRRRVAALLAAAAFCAAADAAFAARQQQDAGEGVVGVDQLAPRASGGELAVSSINGGARSAAIKQLPVDATVSDQADAPEPSLTAAAIAPKGDLYREVERVWQQIRQRGQQPTPELLANEIGPEALARFLAAFPDAEGFLADRRPPPPAPSPEAAPEPVDAQPPR